MDFFDSLDAGWWWVAIGLALAALELIVPGVYLIWLALAAIATGVLTMALGLGAAFQVINFAFIALILVYSAKRWLKERPIESDDPLLNNKAGRLIGEIAIVTVPIESGEGRARLGDSEWIARGVDAGKGTRVKIVGVKGPILEVEPIPAIEISANEA